MRTNNRHTRNAFLVGAAVVAGVLGTLSTLLSPKKTQQGWSQQAKDVASHAIELRNNKRFLGGIAGSLVGVTTALLLAPKSGSDLIKDLSSSFQQAGKSFKSSQGHKKTSTTVKHKAAANRTQIKSSKASPASVKHKAAAKTKSTSPAKNTKKNTISKG